MNNFIKRILDFFKRLFQSSKNTINKNSIEINQNENSGIIMNNIRIKPTLEKINEEESTINYDEP